jgi:hypothetical protein
MGTYGSGSVTMIPCDWRKAMIYNVNKPLSAACSYGPRTNPCQNGEAGSEDN